MFQYTIMLSIPRSTLLNASKKELEISKVEKSLRNKNGNDASIVRFLWWNRRHFVSHGDLDAKL